MGCIRHRYCIRYLINNSINMKPSIISGGNYFRIKKYIAVVGIVTLTAILTTDMFGCRAPEPASGLMGHVVTGCIRKTDGHGSRTTVGAGPLSTMAIGSMIIPTDGCGCPVMNGLLPG